MLLADYIFYGTAGSVLLFQLIKTNFGAKLFKLSLAPKLRAGALSTTITESTSSPPPKSQTKSAFP